jgi:hypothetical protein
MQHALGRATRESRAAAIGIEHAEQEAMNKRDELADRVKARKHELLAKYNELKADTKADAMKARDAVKAQLDEIEEAIKDGWENMTDAVASRVNTWLDKDKDPGRK